MWSFRLNDSSGQNERVAGFELGVDHELRVWFDLRSGLEVEPALGEVRHEASMSRASVSKRAREPALEPLELPGSVMVHAMMLSAR